MACFLRPSDTTAVEVLGGIGARPSVFIQSAQASGIRAIAGDLDGVPIDVSTSPFALPALKAGINILRLIVEGGVSGTDVVLLERCDTGEQRPLATRTLGAAPGGGNPLVRYRIHAS